LSENIPTQGAAQFIGSKVITPGTTWTALNVPAISVPTNSGVLVMYIYDNLLIGSTRQYARLDDGGVIIS
jgi:hypothetical protein